MYYSIFHGGKQADRIDAEMLVKAFVLSVNEFFEEDGIYFFIFHRRSVFIKEFTNQLAVGTVDFWSLAGLWIHDTREVTRRFSEEPEEIHVDHS